MELNLITIIGLVAASLTTGALIPQAVKTWKTRSARDLSFTMYLMLFTGVALWLIYGILRSDLPLILANGVASLLTFIILFLKIKEMRAHNKP